MEKESEQSKRKIERLSKKVKELEYFEGEVKVLRLENIGLKEKLAKYENPKNSNNSSVPPSKDENRPFKSKSLRKKTGRKPGGQKGHEGTTLEMVSDPNDVLNHTPEYCECCGKDLTDTPGEFVGRKQVVDLPPIEPIVTEHRVYKNRVRLRTCYYVFFSRRSESPGKLWAHDRESDRILSFSSVHTVFKDAGIIP